MTIVNKNSTSHSGLLVTGTGDDIDIDVELIGGRTLRMSASGDELGAWPIDECHIEPDPDRNGTFRIVVDGDDAVFTPVDPVGFRSLIEYVTGTGSNGDASPQQLRSDTLGAALDSMGASESQESTPSAADDPVAFLFGSSPPPPPTEVEETPTPTPHDVPEDVELHQPSTDEEALDQTPDDERDPVDDEDVDFDWDELEEVEVTIEPGAADAAPVAPVDESAELGEDIARDDLPDEEDADDRIPPVDDVVPVVSPTLAERLEEAERLEADDAVTIDDAPPEKSRFGASALDRLSEAISSVTSSSSSSPPPPLRPSTRRRTNSNRTTSPTRCSPPSARCVTTR